jgi:hypothetical protein
MARPSDEDWLAGIPRSGATELLDEKGSMQ